MIFLQLWWVLLVFNSPGFGSAEDLDAEQKIGEQKVSEQLQSFSRAVEKASPQLEELWSSYGGQPELDSQNDQLRQRRTSLAGILTGINNPERSEKDSRAWQTEADAWYADLQSKITKGTQKRTSGKQERSAKDSGFLQAEADEWYRELRALQATKKRSGGKVQRFARMEEAGPKYNNKVNQQRRDSQSHFQETQKNKKLKQMMQAVGDGHPEKLHEFREAPYGNYRTNKLDHEANYKLSKIEQEASEKFPLFPKYGSHNKDSLYQKKRSNSLSFNPMDEVKLKTSARLIAKGFGPLLPSESLEFVRKRKMEDWQVQMFVLGPGKNNEDQSSDDSESFDFRVGTYKRPAVDADLDYKISQDHRFYSFDQPQSGFEYRNHGDRHPIDLDEPAGVASTSHASLYKSGSGHGPSTFRDGVGVRTSGREGPMKARLARSVLEGEEDQKNAGLSNIKQATATKEHELKEQEQKLQEPLQDNQAKEARRFPRRTRRVKRSLEYNKTDQQDQQDSQEQHDQRNQQEQHYQQEQQYRQEQKEQQDQQALPQKSEQHVMAKRKAQFMDDFEDHNGNRTRIMGKGLLTSDAEKLKEISMSYPDHELLAQNKVKGYPHKNNFEHAHDPTKKLMPKKNRRAKGVHKPQGNRKPFQSPNSKPHKHSTDKKKNSNSKFNQRTRFFNRQLRQYQGLPLEDQLAATDLLLLELGDMLEMSTTAVRRLHNSLLDKALIQASLDVLGKQQKIIKTSSRFIQLLKMAEIFQKADQQQL